MEEDDENYTNVLKTHAEAILLLQERVDNIYSRANVLETTQIVMFALIFFASLLILSSSMV